MEWLIQIDDDMIDHMNHNHINKSSAYISCRQIIYNPTVGVFGGHYNGLGSRGRRRCYKPWFCKAFYNVPHKPLLKKLWVYGIRGNIHAWVKDFLTNSTQKVKINGASSELVKGWHGNFCGRYSNVLLKWIIVKYVVSVHWIAFMDLREVLPCFLWLCCIHLEYF